MKKSQYMAVGDVVIPFHSSIRCDDCDVYFDDVVTYITDKEDKDDWRIEIDKDNNLSFFEEKDNDMLSICNRQIVLHDSNATVTEDSIIYTLKKSSDNLFELERSMFLLKLIFI